MKKYTMSEVKKEYISMYGNTVFDNSFTDFEEAFVSAWKSFDFFSSSCSCETVEGCSQALTECLQLQHSL